MTNSQSPKQPDEPFQRMQSKSRREKTILAQDPQHFQLFPFVSRLWCCSSFSPIIGTVNNSRRLLTSPSLLSWLGRTWQKAHWCVLEPFSRHGKRKCVHGKLVKPFTVLPQRTSSFKHSVRCSRLRLSGQIIWQLSDAVGGARFRTENWRRPRPGVATQCGARGPR